ncbi:MAG TPA: putative glycolipid-binding domain-containing protein [Pseudonocardiaceae bacterium]|nr:putative glycolipid-binding domain-containing protein [Pseudonocardiaceae bacterium]
MSTPQTGEKPAGEKPHGGTVTRRAPHGTKMLAWAGVDCLRLEAARVVLGERGLRAIGSLVNAQQEGGEAYSASYSLATDETGVVQRLTVRTARAMGEQHVNLTRSEEGVWLVDHGQGAARTQFGGALDVDLAFSPLFNALPIRRLGLHRGAAVHDLPVVFVALPSLEVCRVSQTYRTVSLDEPAAVSISSDSWEVELAVDADGLVLEYPGLARRV